MSRVVMLMGMLALQSSLAQTTLDGKKGAAKLKSGINWKHGAKTIWHQQRFKLQAAFCPTASEEEKQSLPCRFYEIQNQIKTSRKIKEAKIELVNRRAKMFDEEESQPEEIKKARKAQYNTLYAKAWAMYCSDAHKDESICSNSGMKTLVRTTLQPSRSERPLRD